MATLNEDGTRRWIRPRLSPGRFLSRRRAVAWLLIALFTLAPYLRSDGRPLFLLDITARQFTILGRTFLPTDTLLLALFMVGVFITIFLLTALFGRVWCGWACPQTVYMEFVYRPIERFFDGAPGRVNRGALVGTPAAKVLKFVAFLLVSMFLAHTFLAWFVGVDRLLLWVRSSPVEHPLGFAIMAGVTSLMLFDFGYFREQTCLVACPYGRFQAALIDRDSLLISYDRRRGEPRGKPRPSRRQQSAEDDRGGQDEELAHLSLEAQTRRGDCVDCGLCVATCPTGIDIRQGVQMECIGCAQCIDACDAVMTKLKRPIGLIRYSSQSAIALESRRLIRPRVVIYPLILLIVTAAFLIVLGLQAPANVTLLRGLGRPFTELSGGEVSNQIRLKIVNRTEQARTYLLATDDARLRVVSETDPIRIEGGKTATITAAVIAPADAFEGSAHVTRLTVSDDAGFRRTLSYRMLGPVSRHDADRDRTNDQEHHE
jgi:cytochrome c oxidase accessory protein FixG